MIPDLADGTVVIEVDGTPPYNVYVKDAETGYEGHEWVQVGVEGWVPAPEGFIRILHTPPRHRAS